MPGMARGGESGGQVNIALDIVVEYASIGDAPRPSQSVSVGAQAHMVAV